MKKIFIFLLTASLMLGCSKREINFKNIRVDKGIIYERCEDKPYTGVIEKYYESGKLEVKGDFKDGRHHGKHILYSEETGLMLFEKNFKNGKLEGMSTMYDGNGHKIKEVFYKAGKRNGKSVMFNEDGTKFKETDYVNDQIDGREVIFDKEGNVKIEHFYKEGQLVK